MKKYLLSVTSLIALLVMAASCQLSADEYKIDKAHTCVTFKVSHFGLSWIYGRFNEYDGSFVIDKADPGKCSFNLTINADSIDTGIKGRDDHLRSPTFFDAKQFATISFKSTSVKAIENGYKVTGDFTMHGEKKSIEFSLLGGRVVEMKGEQHTGYSLSDLKIIRSEYGIKGFTDSIGDPVYVSVSFEGTKK